MALVQVTKSADTNDGSAATVATAAFSANTTVGNTITGHVSWQGTSTGDLTSVTGQGTATIVDRILVDSVGNIFMATYVLQNITGGATTAMTANFSPNATFRRISAQEFSNIDTGTQPNAHEINASATFGTGTDAVTSAVTSGQTTTATCTLWGAAYDDTTATIPSVGTGFTSADSMTLVAGDAFRIEYKLADASGSGKKSTFTTTAGTDKIGVGFIALTEPSAVVVFPPTLLMGQACM